MISILFFVIIAFGILAVAAVALIFIIRKAGGDRDRALAAQGPLRICPHCSTPLTGTSLYCPACGKPATLLCPRCHKPLAESPEAMSCPGCGFQAKLKPSG
jgi:hypothetical protein